MWNFFPRISVLVAVSQISVVLLLVLPDLPPCYLCKTYYDSLGAMLCRGSNAELPYWPAILKWFLGRRSARPYGALSALGALARPSAALVSDKEAPAKEAGGGGQQANFYSKGLKAK